MLMRRILTPLFLFDADDGAGGGGGTEEPPAKAFTQADVDRIVQDRLAREQSKYSDYEDLKAKAATLAEREQAEATDLENAQREAEEAKQARQQAEEKAQRDTAKAHKQLIRAQVVAEATAAGAVDSDAVHALLMEDSELKTKVTVGDDGQVTGAKDAITALLERKPSLVGKTPRPGPGGGGARTTTPTPDLGSLNDPAAIRKAVREMHGRS